MPKSADDLPLDPFSHTRRQDDTADIRRTEWYAFTQEIDALLGSEQYTWAEGTLSGIRETVERTQQVTAGQRKAVANIRAAKERPRRDGFRRRYEGFGRGR